MLNVLQKGALHQCGIPFPSLLPPRATAFSSSKRAASCAFVERAESFAAPRLSRRLPIKLSVDPRCLAWWIALRSGDGERPRGILLLQIA